MKKFTKTILIILILIFTSFAFCNQYSFAENDVTESNQVSTQITTTVSSTTSSSNDLFSLTNILNIALISVGIVLILLAIAILVKIKK